MKNVNIGKMYNIPPPFLFGCTSSQLQHAGSSSLTKDQTQAPCLGSAESYPLDRRGSPL